MVAEPIDPPTLVWCPLSPRAIERVLEAYDHWPWLRRARDPQLPPLPLNTSSDTSTLRRADERATVFQALLWLYVRSPRQADAVTAYYYERESIAAIAAWHGDSEWAIRKRIWRGVRQMAERTGWVASQPCETPE